MKSEIGRRLGLRERTFVKCDCYDISFEFPVSVLETAHLDQCPEARLDGFVGCVECANESSES